VLIAVCLHIKRCYTDTMNDLEIVLPKIIQIAREAGAKILEYWGKTREELHVTLKADRTALSAADMAAHEIIAEGLFALTPDIPLLSEEGAHLPYEERKLWPRYWLSDPLDGTRGFLEGSREFTVNIALIEGNCSVLGVVYVPVEDICYYATGKSAAYRVIKDQQPEKIHSRALNWQDYTVLLGNSTQVNPLLNRLKRQPAATLRYVNSSYKLGIMASGEADFYPRLGRTSEWDTAAAQCVLEAAGGAVVDFNQQPLQYNAKSSLINPPFLAAGDKTQIAKIISLIEKLRNKI